MVLSAKAQKQAMVVNLPSRNRLPRAKKRKLKLGGPGLVLLVMLGFAVYSFGGQVAQTYKVQTEMKKLQQQMDQLKKRNEDLKKQVSRLESGAWVERAAREKLGLVKPGEKLILEVKPENMQETSKVKSKKSDVH